jgi:hypothetical protein
MSITKTTVHTKYNVDVHRRYLTNGSLKHGIDVGPSVKTTGAEEADTAMRVISQGTVIGRSHEPQLRMKGNKVQMV